MRFSLPWSLCLVAAANVPAQQDEQAALRKRLEACPHKLVFETNRDGNWEIYVMGADGSEPTNLTRTPDVGEVNPKASPDGRWIAFCADTEKDGQRTRDVWRMRADGSGRVRVAAGARDPFWSPDGKELAFLPAEYPRFSFETWATRGLRIHTLETGQTRDHPNARLEHLYTPCFTLDGRWILATVHGGMGLGHAIVAIEVQGDAVHTLRLAGCRTDLAPDGRSVVWGNGDYVLGLADLDLTGERPQAKYRGAVVRNSKSEGHAYHADWSPDGRLVAYSSGLPPKRFTLWGALPQCPGVEAPGWDVWVADAAATNVRVRLTVDGKSNKEPDWLPVPPAEPAAPEGSRGK